MYEILKENNGEFKNRKIYSSRARLGKQRNTNNIRREFNQINVSEEIIMHYMYSNWDNVLSTGIDNIDSEHKELFNGINKFIAAMNEKNNKSEVMKSLELLEKHLIRHFNHEEAIQRQNNYPGFIFHCKQHEELKNELKQLKNLIETTEISVALIVNIQQNIFKCFREHIINFDKDLGKFLVEKYR